MKKQWQFLQPDLKTAQIIAENINCSPITAAVLVNRQIKSAEAAELFLNPSLNDIRPPFSIKGMDVAVRRIAEALARAEKILIFGDYDVDGVTSTALLYEFFQYLKANVTYHIPHRINEGYSLQPQHVETIALPNQIHCLLQGQIVAGKHDRQTGFRAQLQDFLRCAIRQGGFADDGSKATGFDGQPQFIAIADEEAGIFPFA